MADVKVVRIDAGEGKPVKDVIYGYRYPIVVTLEDGTVINGSDTARLLRDVKKNIAALPEVNPVGVKAMIEDGRFYGLSRSFGMARGGGLVPEEF